MDLGALRGESFSQAARAADDQAGARSRPASRASAPPAGRGAAGCGSLLAHRRIE